MERKRHFMFIIGVFLILFTGAKTEEWRDEVKRSAQTLSENVEQFVENVLGAKNLQRYYDTLAFEHRDLDGDTILKRMADSFGQKIFDRNVVIKNLQKVVQESLTTSNEIEQCCMLDPSTMEFDERFKQNIDDKGCYRGSESSSDSRVYLSRRFIEASAQNLQDMPFLLWQYFASESGITTVHPGFKVTDCTSYDGRFRPFYVQANVPEPKDIVLVIDKSGSMTQSLSGSTLMDIAKDAAKTVVSTLNPHDRVGIVAFSSDASVIGGCFSSELARPTGENVELVQQFIQEITAGGNTQYSIALKRAFDFFDSTAQSENKAKDRVLIFLSDGKPTDGDTYIMSILKERNAKLNHSVTVMTYGLGDADFAMLRMMANEDGTLYNESASPGLFTHVSDPTDLRMSMGSYYSFLSSRTRQSSVKPIWSLPYLDKFGIGIMMSVTLPVNDNSGNLAGVVGTDLTMEDFLSDAVYFRPSKLSYAFVIDSFGYVIYHPLFKYPTDHDVKYVEISVFESAPEMKEVIESMKTGGNGSKSFESQKVTPAGSHQYYGVNGVWVTTTIFWKQIPHSTFSLCVVLTQGDQESSMPHLDPQTGDDFLYHRLDLVPPTTPCRHFNNYGAMDQSSVSIGPGGFSNTDSYLQNRETTNDINALRNYMMTGIGGSTVQPGVRDSVWASQETERFWKDNADPEYDRFVMWRYVGTKEGGIRIFPGTQLPKEFDSTVRPWYTNALANRGKAAFTLPYRDAASGSYVMSVSKAVFEGKSGGIHDVSVDEVISVLSADILTQYVNDLINTSFAMCFAENSARQRLYECKLVDTSGFIIFDSTVSEMSDSTVHITEAEPDIARSLLNAKRMTHSQCLIAEESQVQRTYRIVGTYPYDGTEDCYQFTFSPIPSTNVYMIVRTPAPFSCQKASCRCSRFPLESRKCQSSSIECECPCRISSTSYNTCANEYNITSRLSEFPKPCVSGPDPLSSVGRNEEGIESLPKCNIHSYDPAPTTTTTTTPTTTAPTAPTAPTPPPTATAPTPTTNTAAGNASNTPMIVGVCVAVGVLLLIIMTTVFFCRKHKGKRRGRKSNIPTATANTSSIKQPPTAPPMDLGPYKAPGAQYSGPPVSYPIALPMYYSGAQPTTPPPMRVPRYPVKSPSKYYFNTGVQYPM